MSAELYSLDPTAIGICGLSGNDAGLTRLQLPEVDNAHTEARLRRGAVPALDAVPDLITATVGVAMSHNAWPTIVPRHRMLAVNGAMGGLSAYGGTMTKQKLPMLERQ